MPTAITEDRIVAVSENYRLRRDPIQWVLEKRTFPDGYQAKYDERWVLVGYYPKLHSALSRILEHKLLASDARDIRELLSALEDAKREVVELVACVGME